MKACEIFDIEALAARLAIGAFLDQLLAVL